MPENCTPTRPPAAWFASAALAALAALPAQEVLLHEISTEPGAQWIELHNRGAQAVDLSTWSLHFMSRTPGTPQNYWWPLPAGTQLPAGGYLRVHWYAPRPASAPAGQLYTGTTPYDFLFGLGGEPLDPARGALGLLRTQLNGMMNSASVVADWVSWGEGGFPREPLAVGAGLWQSLAWTAPAPAGASLARITSAVGQLPARADEWFVDATPSPGGANLTGLAVDSYGQGCTVPGHHLLGQPTLRTLAMPQLGNAGFGFAVDQTTGVFGEAVLFAFAGAPRPVGVPPLLPQLPGSQCAEAIAAGEVLATRIVPSRVLRTELPLSLAGVPPALAGLQLHAQALVLDWLPNAWPPYQGLTQALQVTFGL